jgi:uncharacterized ubiquitin-like protein YukD
MSDWGAGPADAGTVQVRIQVVDVDPAALDMIVPTYIAAKDLSQRIARDANLGAYWPDGTRREFWIRARGRILGGEEKLDQLGVLNGELLHILPQPPANSGVIERPPDLPSGQNNKFLSSLRLTRSVVAVLCFVGIWAIALSVGPVWYTTLVPAMALGLMVTTVSRHFWGAPGSAMKIPLIGALLFFGCLLVAFVPVFIGGGDWVQIGLMFFLAVFSGLTGVVVGWLGWYGAVEPLPRQQMAQLAQQIQEVREAPCGLCQQPVDLADFSIRLDCQFACGQVFHSGCYRAREAISREGSCAACGYHPDAESVSA